MGRVAFGGFAWDIERDTANARIAWQNIDVRLAKLKLAFFAKNVFNNTYPVFTAPGVNAILAAPRTYGLELGVGF